MAPALLNNRYRTIRLLGSGGFGETFLAEDTYMPSTRRCVIKQLKPVTGNPQIYQLVRDRFQREAAVLEELGEGSSQIPKLYAYFSEGGQFYLVQEWIEGVTLTDTVRAQGKLRESEVRGIVVSLLPVLDYIHKKHIVHRDLKPDNIILRQRDGVPVLIDFGAVKEAMGTVVNSQGNTTSSIVIGTPGFMPSEQAAGRPLFSSDLYALALTAIFLLTGKTPQELEVDPRSGEFVWHQHATHISPDFVAVLDKAIQYHPRDRYPNAPAMLSALQSAPAAPPAPAADISQMETLAVSPGGEEVSPPASAPRPAGGEDWHKPAIIGGVVGALALISLVVTRPQPSPVGTGAISTGSTPALQKTPAAGTGGTPARQNAAVSSPSPKPPDAERVMDEDSTASAKPSPTKPAVSKPSPTQAVQDYYSNLINNRKYEKGWSKLSDNFKRNHSNDSFATYQDWWNLVEQVKIENVKLVKSGAESAVVDVRLGYIMKNGDFKQESQLFSMIWDAATGSWLIDDTN
jgi:serine/threonine-protein kinase